MVEPHKHCPVCGSPIPLDQRVCSNDCEIVWDQRMKKAKKSKITLFVVIVIFILVWFAITFLK